MCRKILLLASLLPVLGVLGTVSAAPVAIVNPGFEALYFAGNLPVEFAGDVPPTAFPVGGAPSGWAPFGAVGGGNSIGVLNPGVQAEVPQATNYPGGAPEGDNVAILYADGYSGGSEFGIEQTLAHTLGGFSRYTLTVEVGNIASGESIVEPFQSFGFFDLRGFPGYRIELLAGGEVIAQDLGGLTPGEGEFATSERRLASVDLDPLLVGAALTIRLVNLNNQDLDDPAVSGLEVNFDHVRLDASPLVPGDANLDGLVNLLDLDILGSNFGLMGGARWVDGDFNGDGNVDLLDLDEIGLNFDGVGFAVPAPGAAWLAAVGLVTLARSGGSCRRGR